MKNKFSIAMSLALIMSMLLTSVGLADNVQDDVTGSGPVSFTTGGSTTIKYWIQDTGSDGCGASDGTPALITIVAPVGVTATPSSLTFTACGTSTTNTQSVVYNSSSAGTYAVTLGATDTGGDTYNTGPANVTLNVNAPAVQSQTITVTNAAPAAATYGSSFNVAATASSGLAVAITTSGSCSGSGSGSATVTMTSGTGTCTVNYNQAGNSSYTAAPQVSSSTIAQKANATINVTGYAVIYDGASHTATGTATGVSSADLSVLLDLSGTTHTAAGTYNSDAWSFAGNGNYNSANGTVNDSIGQASSITTVTCTGPNTYTGSAIEPCSVTVTGAGGLSLTPAPVYANNTNAGSASASYTFAGDDNHTGSSDSETFTIGQASSTVTVTCTVDAPYTYNGSAQTPCTAQATGVGMSPVDVSASLSYLNNTNAGNASANASWAGDANHTGNTGTGAFTINKAPSTTTVTCPASVTYTGAAQTPCSAMVTGAGALSQSLTVTYTNNTNPGLNTATASASYPESANYLSSSDSKTFSILYAAGGLCLGAPGHSILQPINSDGSSVFKKGSTVPAKFRVCDASGNSIGTAGVVSSFRLIQTSNGTVSDVDEAAVSTTPDTAFRWDASGQQWIFNINTKNLTANVTYLYRITLNDGSTIDFKFGLK